jgi:anti-sigma factor RsiW
MDSSAATDLTCRELVELVTDYLEDRLTPVERTRLEAHLDECEGCRRYVHQMRATIAAVGATGDARPADVPGMASLLEAFREFKRGG